MLTVEALLSEVFPAEVVLEGSPLLFGLFLCATFFGSILYLQLGLGLGLGFRTRAKARVRFDIMPRHDLINQILTLISAQLLQRLLLSIKIGVLTSSSS